MCSSDLFVVLGPSVGANSPSSISFPFLLFFCKFGSGSRPKGEGRGGRRGLEGSWIFEASLDDDPFLPDTKSLRLLLWFKAISSSSKLVSIRATISLEEWAVESLSNSSSESESFIGLSSAPSSSKWNWSISASREMREEAVSSFRVANSLGGRWGGSLTGGRSFWAKKPGHKTSIWRILGLLALIAWPASWNAFDKGSKSNTRWTAHSCSFSLTKISDHSTLFRAGTLTKLTLGAMCSLSAKTAEE